MSSADSFLNASAILFAHDIIKPSKMAIQHVTLVAKIFCAVSGVLALLLALKFHGLLELLELANSAYLPIVSVPLLLAILDFRSSTRVVLIGMAAGLLTVVS